jgi:predicted nucleotide-binding protein (sugar kinase/HSP70/actin superfamily)
MLNTFRLLQFPAPAGCVRRGAAPVQQIVESSGTLFFSFQDLDSTKPAGSVKLRIETIAYYLEQHSKRIMQDKLKQHAKPFPLRGLAVG